MWFEIYKLKKNIRKYKFLVKKIFNVKKFIKIGKKI